MNLEIWLIIGLAALVVMSLIWNDNSDAERRNLERKVESNEKSFSNNISELRSELLYIQNTPAIIEYAKLVGSTSYRRSGSDVLFYNGVYITTSFDISVVSQKLVDLKKVIELSCPTKCKKRK